MSAQNKAICPRCHLAEKQTSKNFIKATDKQQLGHLYNIRHLPRQPTLSESYEIYTNEFGTLYISYTCHCSGCGFEYTFTHTEKVI